MIVILRGHVRNSFDDDKLYELIHDIYQKNPILEIFIQTWILNYSDLSWRHIECNNVRIITNEIIYDYFKDLKHLIKHITIIDDNYIELKGNLIGGVCRSCVPVLAWKRYLYGQKELINYLYQNIQNKQSEFIVNVRMDIYTNSCAFEYNHIIEFIEKNKSITQFKKNIFAFEHATYDSSNNKFNINDNIFYDMGWHGFCGIDNIYAGNLYTQHKLINYLYDNLDDIIEKYDFVCYQEYLFLIINETIEF